MGENTNSITDILKARGHEVKYSIPEGVDIIGAFQNYTSLEYIPEEGMKKEEIISTMKSLSNAFEEEVLNKVTKIYADFCEEYGVKVSFERATSVVKGVDKQRLDESMIRTSFEIFS